MFQLVQAHISKYLDPIMWIFRQTYVYAILVVSDGERSIIRTRACAACSAAHRVTTRNNAANLQVRDNYVIQCHIIRFILFRLLLIDIHKLVNYYSIESFNFRDSCTYSSVLVRVDARSWYEVPYYWMGIKMYDLVSGRKLLKSSYLLSKARALERFPMLKREQLKAALVYYDGQMDDTRMCLALGAHTESFEVAHALTLNSRWSERSPTPTSPPYQTRRLFSSEQPDFFTWALFFILSFTSNILLRFWYLFRLTFFIFTSLFYYSYSSLFFSAKLFNFIAFCFVICNFKGFLLIHTWAMRTQFECNL